MKNEKPLFHVCQFKRTMELPLTNSDSKVIVDPDIYAEFVGRKISLNGWGYARFWHKSDQKSYCLHKYVMNNPESQVDHINRDKLDCRRENLRLATASQNNANKGKSKRQTTSQYIGVTWFKLRGKWMAYSKVNGKFKSLGYYDEEVEAAKVRDIAALEEYGPFAVLNFPNEPYEFRVKYVPAHEPQTINNYYNCNITIQK